MNISEYTKFDALGLAALIQQGEVTSAELSQLARQAADQVNDSLNAVVGYVEDIHASSPADNAQFVGVPTFLKDLGASIKGMPQEMGSRITLGYKAGITTDFAQRVLDAGFNILGRTACPEFGLTLTTESIANGNTRNPWNSAHITGGSSGGSAALVAAGVVPLAHTNDGGGSTRIPASICGNVGLKTSRGRISLGPVMNDVSAPLIAEGCNSRTVRDTAAFLDAVAGSMPGEGNLPAAIPGSFLEGLKGAPKKYRIAVSLDDWGTTQLNTEVRSEVERIAESLRQMGHQVEEKTPDIVKGGAIMSCFETLWYSLAHATVSQLAPMTNRVPGPDTLEPTTLDMVEAGSRVSALEYSGAMAFSNVVSRELGQFFKHWDLVLTPTLAGATPRIGSNASLNSGEELSAWFEEVIALVPHTPVANFTGLPAISVPCGIGPGNLPLGMHFLAQMGGEAALLDVAQQLEEAEPWINRRPDIFATR